MTHVLKEMWRWREGYKVAILLVAYCYNDSNIGTVWMINHEVSIREKGESDGDGKG